MHAPSLPVTPGLVGHLREARRSPLLRVVAVAVAALLGAALAVAAAGGVQRQVGPFDTELSLQLDLDGGTRVAVAPLGHLQLATHAGPLRLDVRLVEVREQAARSLVTEPGRLERVGTVIAADVRAGILALALKTALCAGLGAALAAALVFRLWTAAAVASLFALAGLAVAGGVAQATFHPEAVVEPQYEGLLVNAPAVVGDARDIVNRFEQYRQSLAALVTNVSTLYTAGESLPAFAPDPETVRVLHVSDLHLNPTAFDLIDRVARQFQVDAVLDTGDITDWGSAAESAYVRRIGSLGLPYVYLRGNHDSRATQDAVAAQPGAVVVDGQARDVAGLQVFGVGDPRFTPDSSTRGSPEEEAEAVLGHGRAVSRSLRELTPAADVLLLHDPIVAATTVAGDVPLVLSGHTHQRDRYVVDGTLVMVQGSTGGAGLRGLQGEEPTPLTATVLYLDRETAQLQAFDDVTLGGLGTASVTINRTVVTTDYLGSVTRGAGDVVPDTGPTPLPEEPVPTPERSGPESSPPSGTSAPPGTLPGGGSPSPGPS